MSGFFALLDDIATLAKLTVSTIDDTAAVAVKASAKVSAAAVDDVAATPQYVTGITPDRELPIIKRITLGSLRNKLLIILPIGLLLTAVAPVLLPVALVIGGTYLCFEGGEKILESFLGPDHPSEEAPMDEAAIVKRAVTTDFVLSTEIMLLALAEVQEESSVRRVVVLVTTALLITFAVYPALFRGIGIVGTVAMLWVGGHILAVNLAKVGFDPLHRAIEWAGELAHNSVLSWVTGTAMSCFIGAAIGTLLALAWRPVHSALAGRRGL